VEFAVEILIGLLMAATPLVFAATGELVVEKSGVLNLGVEGMMIMGAVAGFAATVATGNHGLGLLAALAAGLAMAAIFALLTQLLLANQVASGLALTLFGLGLSALVGQGLSGISAPKFPRFETGLTADFPLLSRLASGLDPLIWASLALVAGVSLFLGQTRAGLALRAIGDNHHAAHAIGYSVVRTRMLAILFGGAMAGLGGAYMSLVQAPFWAEKMTAGRGWIALALVVFATWKPVRAVFGAYLFGGITILQLHAQAFGAKIDPQVLSMLPYLATILVLVLISRDRVALRLNAPQCLGKPFVAAA
jgi:general nucleoside transport system permease protein